MWVVRDQGQKWMSVTFGTKTSTCGVQDKHGIRFDEVVAVFEDDRALYFPDPQEHLGREMVVGKTRQGRILQSVFTYEDAPLIRIITAFDASEGWRDEYVQ